MFDHHFKTNPNPVTKSLKVESSPKINDKVTKKNKSLTNKEKRILQNVISQCKINGSLYFKISLIVKFS